MRTAAAQQTIYGESYRMGDSAIQTWEGRSWLREVGERKSHVGSFREKRLIVRHDLGNHVDPVVMEA